MRRSIFDTFSISFWGSVTEESSFRTDVVVEKAAREEGNIEQTQEPAVVRRVRSMLWEPTLAL
jgi:hypothetical protein